MQRFVGKKEWRSFQAGTTPNLTFYKATQLHHIFGDSPWEDSLLIEMPEPKEYRPDGDGYAQRLGEDFTPNICRCGISDGDCKLHPEYRN